MRDEQLLSNARENFESGFNNVLHNKYDKPDTNNNRWTGKVVDNVDTKFLGRVKIRIYGYFDDVDSLALPWAVPDVSFVGSTVGNFIVPPNGAIVRGYFDHGDIHKPVYDSLAFNQKTSPLSYKSMSFRLENYPNKMVFFEDDRGDYATLNRITGEFVVNQSTGTTITITPKGDINIDAVIGGVNINVTGDVNIISATGNVSVKALTGDVMLESAVGKVRLGKAACVPGAPGIPVNNLPNCLVTGLPHHVGLQDVVM